MPPETPTTQSEMTGVPPGPNPLRKWIIRFGVIGVVLLILAGGGYAFVHFVDQLDKNKPTPTPAPAITSEERNKVADQKLSTTQLVVNELTADDASVNNLLAKALQVAGNAVIQGDINVTGSGIFGGTIRASNFIGSGPNSLVLTRTF